MTRIRFGAFGVALILMSATAAHAAAKRVGIPKFDGKHEALVRKNVMKALRAHGFELVKSREMAHAISRTGAHLDSDDGLKTLAKELALSAIITGEVGPRRAKIVVHDGSEGSVLGDASFAGANPRKLSTEVGRDFWRKLGADVGRGQVPKGAKKPEKSAVSDAPEDNEESPEGGNEAEAKPKVEPAAESSETPAAESDKPAAHGKKPKMETPPEETGVAGAPTTLPWIDIFVAGGGLNRSLSYHQDISSSPLFPYSLGVGPAVTGKLVFYPLAALLPGALDGLGVEGGIEQVFVSSSLAAGGASFSNVVHEFDGGLRYRIPFGLGNDLYFSGTGGEHAFTFSSSIPTDRINLRLPDAIYHYVRPGAGVRFALPNNLSLSVAAGYRYVFNKAGSQITSDNFFPRLTVAGADAEVELGYAINRYFEVRAGGEWRRYWFNMHAQAGDKYITGGAVDQYFTFTAGLAFLYGGGEPRPASGGGSEEPPPPPPPKPNAGRRHSSDSDSDEKSGGDSDPSDSGADKSGGNDDQ
jgi:hypothetical protein